MDLYSREWHARQAQIETRLQRGVRRTADRSGHDSLTTSTLSAHGTFDRLVPWTHRRRQLNALLRQRREWRALNIPSRDHNVALITNAIRNVVRGGVL